MFIILIEHQVNMFKCVEPIRKPYFDLKKRSVEFPQIKYNIILYLI